MPGLHVAAQSQSMLNIAPRSDPSGDLLHQPALLLIFCPLAPRQLLLQPLNHTCPAMNRRTRRPRQSLLATVPDADAS